jgi:hypothetical protein
MRYRTQRNWGCRIHETVIGGVEAVVLENDRIRVSVLTGKGGDVVEFNVKRHDLDIVTLSPRGVQDPNAFLSTSPDPLATFVDAYPGGWQDVFPSAGAPSTYDGARFGQHGEISTMPWDLHIDTDTEDEIAIRLTVEGRKFPSRIERVMRLRRGEAVLEIEEFARNRSRRYLRAMWSQHITFGVPFLTPGTVITLPDGITGITHDGDVGETGRRVATGAGFSWPTAPTPHRDTINLSVVPDRDTPSDLVYLTGFPDPTAWYEVRSPERPIGVRVEWSRDTLPWLWYWQEFGGTTGYPWYGEMYTIGLEPNSSWPTNGLAAAVANASAMTIPPHGEVSFTMRVSILEDQ